MSVDKNSTIFLGGLSEIRRVLGLSRPGLARLAKIHKNSIYAIEKGDRTGSITFASTLAECLACKIDDLLTVPSEARLREIRCAFTRRIADDAQAAVDAGSVAS